MRHIDNMAKVMLATGLIVGYGYMMETFMAWYAGGTYERYMTLDRMFGRYAPIYWALLFCNILVPQVLWSKRVRSSVKAVFTVAILVNIGMWIERFIIVVQSLHRDFLPSSWGMYYPTRWDWATYVGTIGLFLALIFLLIRFLPMVSIFEMRTLVSPSPATPRVRLKELKT